MILIVEISGEGQDQVGQPGQNFHCNEQVQRFDIFKISYFLG